LHGYAIALVLLAAILHATWNAQLKAGEDRPQFMAGMSLVMGIMALLCALSLPEPAKTSWSCVAWSGVLHIIYNLLLLQNYKLTEFGSAYPIARGISPILVTLGGFFFMHQKPTSSTVAGVVLISAGIVSLATGTAKPGVFATLSALATGVVIASYTVVDGMGVQRAQNAASYTVWVFATYLLMPLVLILLRFDVRTIKPQLLPKAAGAGILSLVAYGVVLWATHYVDVGIVSALRETSVLWAILISLMFLKETFTWPRIISAVMISGGVALIVRTN